MSKSEVLQTITGVSNVEQLALALNRITSGTGIHRTEVQVWNDNGEPLKLRLIEDTLTDGSKVLNIHIK